MTLSMEELGGLGWSPFTLFRRATTPAPPPPREKPWIGRLNTEYAEAYLSCRDRNPEARIRARGLKPFTPEDPCWDVWRIHEPDTAARRLQQYRDEQRYQENTRKADEKARLEKIRTQFPGKKMTLAAPLTVSKPLTEKLEAVPIPYPSEGGIDYRESAGGSYRPRTTRTLPKYPNIRLSGSEDRDQATPVWVLLALGVGFWALS